MITGSFVQLWCICSALLLSGCKSDITEPQEKDTLQQKGWTLVWADEFDYTGLPDQRKWGYDVGGHGWGNQELQYYRGGALANSRVENGMLIIEARKEDFGGNHYTSARLVTTGKGDWTYGRFEVRAKLPSGRGTWPAIWMLPTVWSLGGGGWPDNGEIDIMEHVGYDPGWIHGSVHTKKYYWQIGTQKTAKTYIADAERAFHTYAMEWTTDSIKVFVDSLQFFGFRKESDSWEVWPFMKSFHFVLNIAVGGLWGGQQGVNDAIFPQRMEVDYVRVYKQAE